MDTSSQLSQRTGLWRRWVQGAFALDVRSLSLFRMAIGTLLMCDLVFRSRTLEALYTDSGVIPRDLLAATFRATDAQFLWQWGSGTWSFHTWGGSFGFEAILFGVAFLFALLLAVGAFTRVAVVASFLMLVSLHNRNPFVLTSGDTYLRLILFWMMFLPLARCWSIDSWRAKRGAKETASTTVANGATAGLVFQVFILYFFTGVAKCNDVWWQGDAMFVVLNLSIYVTDFGRALRNWTLLDQIISWATVATEILLPPLLLVGWRNATWRWLNLIVFCGLHLGVLLSMSIGLFSFICIGVWIALLPPGFWSFIGRMFGRNRSWFAVTGRGLLPVSTRTSFAERLVHGFCWLMIPYMLSWNVLNIFPNLTSNPVYDPNNPSRVETRVQKDNWLLTAYETFGQVLGVGQHFQMFGFPTMDDPWFVYRATLVDGSRVDIFDGGRELKPDQPLKGIAAMPPFHWRKYHHDLVGFPDLALRRRLGDYAIEKWNQSHGPDKQVAKMTLECYLDTVWPVPVMGETRGAVIWGNYPDGPQNPFQNLYQQVIGEGQNKGF